MNKSALLFIGEAYYDEQGVPWLTDWELKGGDQPGMEYRDEWNPNLPMLGGWTFNELMVMAAHSPNRSKKRIE